MRRLLIKLLLLLVLSGLVRFPVTNAFLADTETSTSNTFTAGCWTAPTIPTLLTPTDNSATNSADLTLDWSDSSFICPNQTVEYLYELNGLESNWQSDSEAIITALAEGTYTWRVKARDSQGYQSAYSALFTVIVDRTTPQTLLKFNTYTINEQVINGGFESGLTGWTKTSQVLTTGADVYTVPHSGSFMARIGHRTALTGNEIWENKLTQKLSPGAKNLSFYYNFFSFDTDPFDNPGIIVRLNDYNVFYLSAGEIDIGASPNSSGWQQVSFDISQIDEPVLEIIFYSGNTDDNTNQSWAYIDDVSTSEAVVTDSSVFNLSATDNLSGVVATKYSLDGMNFTSGSSFDLSGLTGSQLVYYYSIDKAGNSEGINTRRLTADSQAPSQVTDLDATATSKQTVMLTWTVPADLPSGLTPSVYELSYTDGITSTVVPNPPAPQSAGSLQMFEVSGLNSDTTYTFNLKSADSALNWSAMSNSPSATTLDAVVADPNINPGDVVINELMWMGTSYRVSDEYVELRNMTDQTINLNGWYLTKQDAGGEVVMLTLGPTNYILDHDYFLISEYGIAQSKINVTPDYIVGTATDNNAAFVLGNTSLQIRLYDSAGTLIDTADNDLNTPAAGQFNSAGSIYYSMERDNTPGDGTKASSWHTCYDDSSLMHSYWDAGSLEKGTPGAPNLSQPTASQLELIYKDHQAEFKVLNISQFNQLKYELTYDSDSGPQGISGTIDINNQPIVFVSDLILGTCSEGGTCVYHQNFTKLNLSVTLSGLIERTLTTQIEVKP